MTDKRDEDRAGHGGPAKPHGNGLGRVFERRHGPPPKPGEKDTRPKHWWIAYYVNGKEVRESAKATSRKEAQHRLKARVAEVAAGRFAGLKPERVTFDDLVDEVRKDYVKHGLKSWSRVERAITHLRKVFGRCRAVNITRAAVDSYIGDRLNMAKPATVQQEIAALGRMFTLAVEAGRLAVRPRFDHLDPKNTRTKEFTADELSALIDVLELGRPATATQSEVKANPGLAAAVAFAGTTGWRFKSEVLPLEWRRVDFETGVVWLDPGTTKNEQPRVFPIDAFDGLVALLRRQLEVTRVLERERGVIIPWVFHRHGRPMKYVHAAWTAACSRAGLPGRWPHDLRRTGARRLRGLGLSDRDIAELCGWETIEMVSRYLGKDPAGVAARLRTKVAESKARARTKHGTLALSERAGD
jgi:integrase